LFELEGIVGDIGQLDFIGGIGVEWVLELEGTTEDRRQLDFIGYIGHE
jgi:hypothetical protein